MRTWLVVLATVALASDAAAQELTTWAPASGVPQSDHALDAGCFGAALWEQLLPDRFWVRIYDDAGSAPGTLLHTSEITDYEEGYEEFLDGYLLRYCAVLDEPFSPHDGDRYWVSFQAQFCFPPKWGTALFAPAERDESNEPMRFRAGYFGFDDWATSMDVYSRDYETPFRILGDAVIPVEETSWGAIKAMYARKDGA